MNNFVTLLLAGIVALALYVAGVFVIAPIYRQRQRYAAYLPLSFQGDSSSVPNGGSRIGGPIHRLIDRIISAREARRNAQRAANADFSLEDEELEENPTTSIEGLSSTGLRDASRHGTRSTRDLEAGFADDSEDEQGDSRLQHGRPVS